MTPTAKGAQTTTSSASACRMSTPPLRRLASTCVPSAIPPLAGRRHDHRSRPGSAPRPATKAALGARMAVAASPTCADASAAASAVSWHRRGHDCGGRARRSGVCPWCREAGRDGPHGGTRTVPGQDHGTAAGSRDLARGPLHQGQVRPASSPGGCPRLSLLRGHAAAGHPASSSGSGSGLGSAAGSGR